MTARTGRGPGRPVKAPVELSDASLLAICIYFLKQVKNRSVADPAIGYLSSLEKMNCR
jgi:hypothetical protein